MSAPSSIEVQGHYLADPQPGLATRLTQWRDDVIVRKALQYADDPGLVLELPCESGRFWPVLAEKNSRIIVAATQSSDQLGAICASQRPDICSRIMPLQTTLLDIDLPDNCVDCIFSLQLFTYIEDSILRMELLQELHRVTRETVIISVGVGLPGSRTTMNASACSQLMQRFHWPFREQARSHRTARASVVISRVQLENEFIAAGFHIQQRLGFSPVLAGGRLYVLRKT